MQLIILARHQLQSAATSLSAVCLVCWAMMIVMDGLRAAWLNSVGGSIIPITLTRRNGSRPWLMFTTEVKRLLVSIYTLRSKYLSVQIGIGFFPSLGHLPPMSWVFLMPRAEQNFMKGGLRASLPPAGGDLGFDIPTQTLFAGK
ncbi:hypothetical protein GGR50DRAFT_137345 [Xylaria sp. CBS 124048]|nr:hypothetical protein GGR50DRAFT_137345 [Xylaria sp. CBS 124048]